MKRPTHVIVDANGREWEVYDFRLEDGQLVGMDLGTGEQRIFVPTDGGARRYQPLYTRERERGASLEVLLEQLARNVLWTADDPNYTNHIVQLEHEGRHFTFRVERTDGVDFWTVESDGQFFRSPLSVDGGETPNFFRELARAAMVHYGL
ncbi:MAG TPA: hypothetical protein VGM50_23070 [Gemmatimonadaceae bacterium]|jgi:hypothetical protein